MKTAEIKKTLLARAKKENALWPYNALAGHRYTLKKIREFEKANGGFDTADEFVSYYREVMTRYVNNSNNW